MYNRYIPQSDGSFQRNRIPDPKPDPPAEMPCPPPEPPRPPHHTVQPSGGMAIGSFLKQILPKGFDTGDLIVVLLLLLMAADCKEEQNTALLTLALYLFM